MTGQIEARSAVQELFATYCERMDLHDFEGFSQLFAEDGTFDATYMGCPTGRPAIRDFIAGIVPTKGEGPQRKHIMTNIIVEADGDTAQARSTFILVREAQDQIIIAAAGRYEDELVRRDGRWLFKVRKLLIDFQVDLGLKGVEPPPRH